MIFSLEAFQADHGDSLLLHYGEKNNPKFILIDGGPRKETFISNTANRLNELRTKFPNDEDRLTLQMLMVSHIDEDHVGGLLAMTKFLLDKQLDAELLPYDIRTLWFNSFDELLGNQNKEIFNPMIEHVETAGVDGTFPNIGDESRFGAAIVASVNQGRRLRRDAGKLGWALNHVPEHEAIDGLSGMIVRPENGLLTINWDEHLKLTILAPDVRRLKRLRSKWDAAIRAHPNVETLAGLAAFDDTSVANLSSIVVIAECGGKSMLLTGDARGDDIIKGTEAAGLFKNGKLKVDLLKLPHHGSDRNGTKEFFEQYPASHYVASGDGKHGNPELVKTFEKMIEGARTDDDFTIHLTNNSGPEGFGNKFERFMDKKVNERGREYEVKVRKPDERSIMVDLLEPVDY